MDSVTECSLSEYADDIKLGGAVDTLEGRDDMQMYLDRLERFSCGNLMRFTKAKCKDLQLDWGNLKHNYRLGGDWVESCSEGKDLGCWWMRSSTCAGNVILQPRKPTVFWVASIQFGPKVDRVDSLPQLCFSVLHSALGPKTKEGHGIIRSSLEEAKNMIESLGHLFNEDWLRKLVLFNLERPYSSLPVPKGGLKEGALKLGIRKTFFPLWGGGQWNRLPREVVSTHPLPLRGQKPPMPNHDRHPPHPPTSCCLTSSFLHGASSAPQNPISAPTLPHRLCMGATGPNFTMSCPGSAIPLGRGEGDDSKGMCLGVERGARQRQEVEGEDRARQQRQHEQWYWCGATFVRGA